MDRLKMQSKNLVNEHVEKIAQLFPNCVTEAKDENGKLTKLVDFDLLKQELSNEIVEGNDERYTMNWPDKKQAILTANAPISKTLRPCTNESVNFEDTKNLYIEGDNLDVLKLLRETYLSKIKLIYIDPPYNTGNDFVYNDDFATNTEEYFQRSNQIDEQGNRMVTNSDSNGRFHTDWLNMIYSRIKLAKDLLTDDGVIFISIDDNELVNLKKVCDEIFGEPNFINLIVVESASTGGLKRTFKDSHYLKTKEYLLVYGKNSNIELKPLYTIDNILDSHYSIYFDGKNYISLKQKISEQFNSKTPQNLWLYDPQIKKFLIENAENVFRLNGHEPPPWVYDNTSEWELAYENNDMQLYKVTDPTKVKLEYIRKDKNGKAKDTNIFSLALKVETISGNKEICTLRGDLWKDFHKDMGNVTKEGDIIYPNGKKPLRLLTDIITSITDQEDIIMDFFSGSATTAHAVMQVNAQELSNRKFIMVQIPEIIDYSNKDNVKNYEKYGFKTICDLGRERIRRAGTKLKEENQITAPKLDVGFRCLKLDSSCMKDVYYSPSDITQSLLDKLEDNIKEDRTPEDLLFQVMLDMGVMLSSEIKVLDIKGKKVFNVNDGNLVCCFDKNLTETTVTEIAKMQPLYAVFRDSSMASDSVNVNFDQIFETYSPTTTRKVL